MYRGPGASTGRAAPHIGSTRPSAATTPRAARRRTCEAHGQRLRAFFCSCMGTGPNGDWQRCLRAHFSIGTGPAASAHTFAAGRPICRGRCFFARGTPADTCLPLRADTPGNSTRRDGCPDLARTHRSCLACYQLAPILCMHCPWALTAGYPDQSGERTVRVRHGVEHTFGTYLPRKLLRVQAIACCPVHVWTEPLASLYTSLPMVQHSRISLGLFVALRGNLARMPSSSRFDWATC